MVAEQQYLFQIKAKNPRQEKGMNCEWVTGSCSLPTNPKPKINTENVKEAVKAVEPFGLDLCSGVRTHGRLDSQKLEWFVRNVNSLEF